MSNTTTPQEHWFDDPLSGQQFPLIIGEDREHTGVNHWIVAGCEQLADVLPEYDCASCTKCHWQARISGAWFMDLWRARPEPDCPGCGHAASAHPRDEESGDRTCSVFIDRPPSCAECRAPLDALAARPVSLDSGPTD